MSLAVTSSHRQAKHLPRPLPALAAGTATGARVPASLARAAPAASSVGARLVVAEAERVRGVGARQLAGEPHRIGTLRADDLARGVHAVGQLEQREAPALRVVVAARAGLQQQRAGGRLPPETTSRSHSTVCSSPPSPTGARTAALTALRPRASTTVWPASTASSSPSGPGSGRRSATATISTPASRSATAASRPRSDAVTTTARDPGRTEYRDARRRAPPESITPGRSLPANTSGCSIAPVAYTRSGARTWCSVSPCQTGTMPSKSPSATAGERISTPAARTCSTSASSSSALPSTSSRPPGAGPSSASTTSAPRLAARAAAARPATPPPTTSTSAWRRRYSVRHSRSAWRLGSRPRPAAWRSTFS